MPAAPAEIHSLEDLRDYIHTALCRQENLLENCFPMTEFALQRRGRCCGYQFTLHGPRSVRLSAVWDRDRNQILLYDALGRRFARQTLPGRIAIQAESSETAD
ncbi:MAG: hypothetical protein KDA89_14225 [Planctomycetaceae bacterium]|nr:hypothetical protein [Planctomycetaceae bacterium]